MKMFQTLLLVMLAKMAAGTDLDLQEKYLTMPRHEFIEYFNSQNFSWKMQLYTESRPIPRINLPIDNIGDYHMQEHEESDLNDLPENFDSREQWPHCKTIKEIYDQTELCGSCWAFATANSVSDRTCIHKNIQVHLAEQDLQCLKQDVCSGGYGNAALDFWKEKGLVTINCKPYDIEKLKHGTCQLECVDKNMNYTGDKHFGESVYQVKNDVRNIRAELFKNGPVLAHFMVFSDFLHYKSGVYVHKVGKYESGHVVRVLGYGVEDGIEYWLVANTSGPKWGMDGYFKIKINQEDVMFEKFMFSGIPKN